MNPKAKAEQKKVMHAQHVRNEMLKLQADIHKRLKEIVKEPPKWFPRVIWYRLAAIFLNL